MSESHVEGVGVSRSELIHHRDVGIDEIADMDVVADARSVVGVVIVAENHEFLSTAGRDLEADWNQVRLRAMVLTDPGLRIAARDVEVAKRREGKRSIGEAADTSSELRSRGTRWGTPLLPPAWDPGCPCTDRLQRRTYALPPSLCAVSQL